MKESWKWIPGYSGLYSASNHGRVRSKDKWVPCRGGGQRLVKGRTLSSCRASNGYLTVRLTKDGTTKTLAVHRIIAQTWIPNPDQLPMVLHLDDDKTNNKRSNLQWGTHQDNMDDMLKKGRGSKGETKGSAKLTDKKVLKIRKLSLGGLTQRELAEKFNVTQSAVSSIISRKTWIHI